MARVLTEAEVRKLPFRDKFKTVPVVMEEKVPVFTHDKGSILKWVGSNFAREQYLDSLRRLTKEYGRTFRIWNGMPTEKEMVAAEWRGGAKCCADCEYSDWDKCEKPCCHCVDHSEFMECEGGEKDE